MPVLNRKKYYESDYDEFDEKASYGYGRRNADAYHYRGLPNVTDDALRKMPALKRDSKLHRLPSETPAGATVNAALRTKCLTMVLLLTVFSMLLALHRGYSADRAYQLVELRREASRLEKENEALKVEIALLKSPQRIKELAIAKIGMIVPENAYFSSGGANKQKNSISEVDSKKMSAEKKAAIEAATASLNFESATN